MQFQQHSDGSTHVVFDPRVLIERLAALVPRPRRHVTTYHGVFAPDAAYRDRIVPPPPEDDHDPAAIFGTCQHRRKTGGATVPHRSAPSKRIVPARASPEQLTLAN